MTDVELLNLHRQGSDDAFADLVRRHIDWVYALARRRLCDAHAAEDVTQAVFVLLHRKSPRLPSDRAMVTWLHKAACYSALAAAKADRRRRHRETKAAMLQPTVVSPDEPRWESLAPILDELITRLPRADREAILLRYYRDMPYADIAAELSTTSEAARKRVERALEKLRQHAQARNIVMSSTALAAALGVHVRVAPPAGLVATSTAAATTSAGSAIAVPSASIVKGASLMIAMTKLKLVAVASIVAVIVMGKLIIAAQSAPGQDAAAASAPAPNLSAPFTNVRWKGNTPEIEVNKTWYELVALNDQPAAEIVEFTQKTYGPIWQKRFGEDLVDVMNAMQKPVGATVKLQLRTLDTQQMVTQPAVAMTTENRWATWTNLNPDLAKLADARGKGQPAGGTGYPRLSPYPGIRWPIPVPQVQVDNVWYELIAIDDIPAEKIIAFAQATYGDIWQKRFDEDLVEVLTKMNHKPGDTVKLSLRTLDTKAVVSMPSVAMTKENRRAIMEQKFGTAGQEPSL